MTKRKTNKRSTAISLDTEDKRVLWRTVLFASITLGIILTLVYLLSPKLFPNHPGWLNAVRTGASLFAFWVVITSTVRTYDKIRKGVSFIWLVIIGATSASAGILLFLLTLRVWNKVGDHGATLPGYNIIGFYAAAGAVASMISLIHLRVKNEKKGNLLELAVFGLSAFLFFWATK